MSLYSSSVRRSLLTRAFVAFCAALPRSPMTPPATTAKSSTTIAMTTRISTSVKPRSPCPQSLRPGRLNGAEGRRSPVPDVIALLVHFPGVVDAIVANGVDVRALVVVHEVLHPSSLVCPVDEGVVEGVEEVLLD